MHYVQAKGLLSAKNGINTYRGCSHGCIYCDARSDCYGFDHPFEDIEVKQNAPQLLAQALKSKRRRCMIGTGSMCDPYLHIEEKPEITRQCLQIIDAYGFGVSVLTKSSRVLRDMELYKSINSKAKAVIQMTMTTYDEKLCSILEPNVSTTHERFETLMKFKEAGIPTMVWMTPILPFINDTAENINGILDYCIEAGVKGIVCFGIGLTLREGDREYYYAALDRLFPGLKERYIRTYGNAYELPVPNSTELMSLFRRRCQENNIMCDPGECFAYIDELPESFHQESFFD